MNSIVEELRRTKKNPETVNSEKKKSQFHLSKCWSEKKKAMSEDHHLSERLLEEHNRRTERVQSRSPRDYQRARSISPAVENDLERMIREGSGTPSNRDINRNMFESPLSLGSNNPINFVTPQRNTRQSVESRTSRSVSSTPDIEIPQNSMQVSPLIIRSPIVDVLSIQPIGSQLPEDLWAAAVSQSITDEPTTSQRRQQLPQHQLPRADELRPVFHGPLFCRSQMGTRNSTVLMRPERRMRSFSSFPAFLTLEGRRLTRAALVNSCFFYSRVEDRVQCCSCRVIVYNFSPDDDADLRHALASRGQCSWLRNYIFLHDADVNAGVARIQRELIEIANNRIQPFRLRPLFEPFGTADDDSCPHCERLRCKLCFERIVGVSIIGCGHTICAACSLTARDIDGRLQCPFCMAGVVATQRLFFL